MLTKERVVVSADMWLAEITEQYIAGTAERLKREQIAEFRAMPAWEIASEVEHLMVRVLETNPAEMGEAEFLILTDGFSRELDLLAQEMERRERERSWREGNGYHGPKYLEKEFVRALKDRIDGDRLAELIVTYDSGSRLKREGERYVGLCPFHDDSTPSFMVYPSGRWVCFGCRKSGDAFSYLQERGLRWRDSVAAVAQWLGVALPATGERPIWEAYPS